MESRISDDLWQAQVNLMHLITPRKRALELWRTQCQVILGCVEVAYEQVQDLGEQFKLERKGLRISGTLCQLSETSLEFNHGGGIHFEGEHPRAIRGVLADLMPEDYRYLTIIMDYGRSRQFYDQANNETRQRLVNSGLSYFRQFEVPNNCYFSLLSPIAQGFRVD